MTLSRSVTLHTRRGGTTRSPYPGCVNCVLGAQTMPKSMLSHLHEVIDSIDLSHFSMHAYYHQPRGPIPAKPNPLACGTTCCLAGWAAFHPVLGKFIQFKPVNDTQEEIAANGSLVMPFWLDFLPLDLFGISDEIRLLLFLTDIDFEPRAAMHARVSFAEANPLANLEEIGAQNPEPFGLYSWDNFGEL